MTSTPFFITSSQRPAQTFPVPAVVSVTSTGFATDTTAHSVAYPSTVAAGNLLLLLWTNDLTATVTTPTGYTLQYNAASTARGSAFKKIAVGNEGGTTLTVTTSAVQAASAQMYNITDWYGDLTGVVSVSLSSPNTGTVRSAPALTSGFGNVDTLWIVGCHGSATQTVTALPTSFTDLTTTAGATGTTGGQTYSGRRFLKAANLTPGDFTISASATVVFVRGTVAIRGVL